jgi:hypothetical protein
MLTSRRGPAYQIVWRYRADRRDSLAASSINLFLSVSITAEPGTVSFQATESSRWHLRHNFSLFRPAGVGWSPTRVADINADLTSCKPAGHNSEPGPRFSAPSGLLKAEKSGI